MTRSVGMAVRCPSTLPAALTVSSREMAVFHSPLGSGLGRGPEQSSCLEIQDESDNEGMDRRKGGKESPAQVCEGSYYMVKLWG